MFQFYVTEELKKEFTTKVRTGSQSDVIRGLVMLYLKDPNLKKLVDDFVKVTKTI